MKYINDLIQLINVELYTDFKTRWKYKAESISDFVVLTGIYLAVMLLSSSSVMNAHYHTRYGSSLVLIGYLFWNTGVTAMDVSSQGIRGDAQIGILESTLQSKFSIWFTGLIRSWVANVFMFAYLIIIIVISNFFLSLSIKSILFIIVSAFAFSLVSNVGMYGVGLLFGAMSLKFKRPGQWATLLQAAVLFVSNVALPYSHEYQIFFPFSLGIEIVRTIFLGGNVNFSIFGLFILINSAWLLVGVIIFKIALINERKNGSFELF